MLLCIRQNSFMEGCSEHNHVELGWFNVRNTDNTTLIFQGSIKRLLICFICAYNGIHLLQLSFPFQKRQKRKQIGASWISAKEETFWYCEGFYHISAAGRKVTTVNNASLITRFHSVSRFHSWPALY